MSALVAHLRDPVAVIGTVIVMFAYALTHVLGRRYIHSRVGDPSERYRLQQILNIVLAISSVVIVIILWVRLLPNTSTFLGLVGAGLAVALREPLLSVAARVSNLLGGMYTAGDRIEINKITGDVIDVGFFYTRMMEVGNWIGGDLPTGRTVQFANAMIYGTPIYNYTQNFSYIWDEIHLPVTYESNIKAASDVLLDAGREYSKNFLQGAGAQLEAMRRAYLVPDVELEPTVFMKVTSNWIELALRYVVDPKQRRKASNFIFHQVFEEVQHRQDIGIASQTMDLTVHPPAKRRATEGVQGSEAAD